MIAGYGSARRRVTMAAFVCSMGLLSSLAAGCKANDDAYVDLQNAMKSHITKDDGRPVKSVSCTPHVHGTMREETAHLRCLVAFTDGGSYTANAEIQNQNSGGRHNMPDSYRWDSPPQ